MITPGPWRINRHGHESLYACHEFVESDLGIGICGIWHPEDHGEQECNARLIAAAPELYEALKEAERLYTTYGLLAQIYPDCGEWINKTRAILAKVEG